MGCGRSPVAADSCLVARSSPIAASTTSRHSSRLSTVTTRAAGYSHMATELPVLSIRDLTVEYRVQTGLLSTRRVRAVDGIDLRIEAGQTVALVGESGSGK